MAMRLSVVAVLWLASLANCQTAKFETTVTPLPSEDIASDCRYTLTIPAPAYPVRAVWVIFDRGHDVHDLYSDKSIVDFARRLRIALLLHGHCPGKQAVDHGDMHMDPSAGLSNSLFRAIDKFAEQSGHRELSSTKLIFLGFSGAGALCARFVNLVPSRVIAAILSSPGHYKPFGIDTVELNHESLAVPQLILVGSADNVSGTALPYAYFRKYRDLGAPWAFIVQNRSPHCCTANAKTLMLHWLEAVIARRQPIYSEMAFRDLDQRVGWLGFLKTRQTETIDSFGMKTFRVVAARTQMVGSKESLSPDWQSAGWLPDHEVAREWSAFVRQRQHPILPLH